MVAAHFIHVFDEQQGHAFPICKKDEQETGAHIPYYRCISGKPG